MHPISIYKCKNYLNNSTQVDTSKNQTKLKNGFGPKINNKKKNKQRNSKGEHI